MKKTILLIFSSWLLSAVVLGQKNDNNDRRPYDTITVVSNFGGLRFYHQNMLLKQRELTALLKTNEEAYANFKSAKANAALSTILAYAGGFMIGWPIGTAIGRGKPQWALAGVGAGLVGLAIPLSISSNRKMKTAIHTYNSGL